MTQQLRNPAPPRLPDPGLEYARGYQDSLLQVLRLYFNQLFNVLNNIIGPRGGTYLQTAYAVYVSDQDQTAALSSVAYPITFNSVRAQSGVTQISPSEFRIDAAGEYEISLEVQFANTASTLYLAALWYRINGANVDFTRARYSVTGTHGGNNGHMAANHSVLLDLEEGDVVQMAWWAENSAVLLEHLPAAGTPDRPQTASARVSFKFVSATPAP